MTSVLTPCPATSSFGPTWGPTSLTRAFLISWTPSTTSVVYGTTQSGITYAPGQDHEHEVMWTNVTHSLNWTRINMNCFQNTGNYQLAKMQVPGSRQGFHCPQAHDAGWPRQGQWHCPPANPHLVVQIETKEGRDMDSMIFILHIYLVTSCQSLVKSMFFCFCHKLKQ